MLNIIYLRVDVVLLIVNFVPWFSVGVESANPCKGLLCFIFKEGVV
jgi:hypothetical protein